MVPLEEINADFILRDMYVSLLAKFKIIDLNSIDGAFACWVYPKGRPLLTVELPNDLAMSNYTHVAHLGYLMDIEPDKYNLYIDKLRDGLNRTSLRPSIIINSPAPFCNDAVALFGLALGAKRIGGEILAAMLKWMLNFPNLSTANLPEWKKALIQSAFYLLGNSEQSIYETNSSQVADIQLALASRGIASFPMINFDDAYHAVCNSTIYHESEFSLIGARLQAIYYLSNHLPAISLSQPSIEQLVKILNNLTHAFRRWSWETKAKTKTSDAQRWDIQNEYHVQNMLYFLLAPIFPDIESEFYLENLGSTNPRADIGLPSLNLIIEVKYLRMSKSFQNMQEEIAADNTLYFKDSGIFKDKYSKMLVFLWDDTNRDQEHTTFRNGVNSFKNVVDTVIVSRPGLMCKTL